MSCMLLLRPTGVLEAGRLGGLDGPARPAGPTYLLRLEVDMSNWHMRVVGSRRDRARAHGAQGPRVCGGDERR